MNKLLSVSLPTITLLVAGAWSMHRAPLARASSQTDTPTVTETPLAAAKTPKMWANTGTLYKGESIDLHFAAPNPPFLGVVDPSGHFFYVVFPKEAAVGKLKPFVDSRRFAKLEALKIRTNTLTADPYTYGVYTNQPVFTKSGTYTFILGENLHVDDPEFVDKVVVQYVHGHRPAKKAVTTDVAMN